MPMVLFVCRANLYRSPLAAAYFKLLLQKRLGPDAAHWQVESAGTWAQEGLPAHPWAQQAAEELGFLLQGHRSRPVNHFLMTAADLVLVMEHSQKEALVVEYPTVSARIWLLSESVGLPPFDIPDPLRSEESHLEIAREICRYLEQGFERILGLAV